jgi:hypothetical protein
MPVRLGKQLRRAAAENVGEEDEHGERQLVAAKDGRHGSSGRPAERSIGFSTAWRQKHNAAPMREVATEGRLGPSSLVTMHQRESGPMSWVLKRGSSKRS